MKKLLLSSILLVLMCQGGCGGKIMKDKGPSTSAPDVWTQLPPSYWSNLLPDAKTDSSIPLPQSDLSKEDFGTKTRIADLFDRWTLNEDKRDRLFYNYADVTEECKGLIEEEFAFSPKEWSNLKTQIDYFKSIDELIDKVATKLLEDMKNPFEGEEKELFIRALKSITWNESLWQHYYRYKDWFFVLLSDQPFNKLSNWGLSQIARSDYLSGKFLNQNFFSSKAYCKVSSTLYYGFLIYYYYYMDARSKECNGGSTINRLIGAYNSYSSGYSACFTDISTSNPDMRRFQIGALGGFLSTLVNKRWEQKVENLEKQLAEKAK